MEAHYREAKEGVWASTAAMQELGSLVQEERSELVQAAGLLQRLTTMEVEDRSLAVHCMQLIQETARLQKKKHDKMGLRSPSTPAGIPSAQRFACDSV